MRCVTTKFLVQLVNIGGPTFAQHVQQALILAWPMRRLAHLALDAIYLNMYKARAHLQPTPFVRIALCVMRCHGQ